MKYLYILFIFCFLNNVSGQIDSNYLYIDTIHINTESPNYHLRKIVFKTENDSITLSNKFDSIYSIAIPKSIKYSMILYSDSSTIIINNLNEILGNYVKTSIWIDIISIYENCLESIYFDSETGAELMTQQSSNEWENVKNKSCNYLYAGPTSYDFSEEIIYLDK